MVGEHGDDYLAGLPPERQAELAQVNGPGLTALHGYLDSGAAVAFLGAGVSAPLYPLWDGLISELVDAAAGRVQEREAETIRALARESPEEVVEVVRRELGVAGYRAVLREVLRVRTDPESGRSWTPVQELVCRCTFKAVVTTNYDPGIVDARMKVRPGAFTTGFTTWEDELGLDRWRSGDVFGDAELPVLFAHGQHNRPDSVVLATTEYRRAYAGKLPHVLGGLMVTGHLVWIGFSFGDQRVAAVLREIASRTGTREEPGGDARHVALMAWDPDAAGNDPGILARRAEIAYGAQVVLYPVQGGDHSALGRLLATLTDPRFPPADAPPVRPGPAAGGGAKDIPAAWVPAAAPVANFTGRAEELARLDRWAADPQVSLIGVTAWGGAGKTALVTHWVQEAGGVSRRPGIRGIFGWSFYANPSADRWAEAVLRWAAEKVGIAVTGTGRPAAAVLAVLRMVPLLLVLDGLEVAQEGSIGGEFGRLLDGTLREVLAGACQLPHAGLVVLTSRFPFADLETFDGGTARMLDVPPFTPAEGSALMTAAGGAWLAEDERRALVRAVDGHALATGVLAGLLADHPPVSDLAALRAELADAARTDARVGRVLEFYADRLSMPDRYLLAAVSLFARPVPTEAVLAVAKHESFRSQLAGWTPGMVRDAVRDRLGGLATWHPDGTISAHPLVRDTFRRLVLDAVGTAAETFLAGIPEGVVTTRPDALRVVEAIELLAEGGHWGSADDLYMARSRGTPSRWLTIPAVRLGQRAATAFVATPARRDACGAALGTPRVNHYLNAAGLYATHAGDLATAYSYISMSVGGYRNAKSTLQLTTCLKNLTECLVFLGDLGLAREAATEAVSLAAQLDDWEESNEAHLHLAWVATQLGDAAEAEEQFTAADKLCFANDVDHDHLYSLSGIWWAEWLARTGRPGPARRLTDRNAEVSREEGWNENIARCDRMYGRLALAIGDTAAAGARLTAAAECFRDGDHLTELAPTLIDMADWARTSGDLTAAERHLAEAITIAAPRQLVLSHSAAMAARGQIRAAQATISADPKLLYQGRDAADAALRLAVRHHLAWHELDAMRAHTALDQAEGIDRGWAAKADALHSRLMPPDLDPDPLVTVERLVAGQKAAEADRAPETDL